MRYLIIFCVILFPVSAFGEVDCKFWDDGTQSKMTHCTYEEYQRQDRELNRVWKILKLKIQREAAELKEDGAPDEINGIKWPEALLAGQTAWIEYRDNQCIAERFFWQGGSGASMIQNICLARVTKARVKEFKFMINDLQ